MTKPDNKVVFVAINGILARAGASEGWTDRAATWLNTRTPYKAEKWEYVCGPLTRRLRQQSRARRIATMLAYYERAGFRIVLIGHSNGCDLIARVLALRAQKTWYFKFPILSAHLFAAAADWSDFKGALDRADLLQLHLYGSESDWALKFARVSRALVGWAGLGYGSLGLRSADVEYEDRVQLGDNNASPRVFDHSIDSYGHSSWFRRGEIFEATMNKVWRNTFLP